MMPTTRLVLALSGTLACAVTEAPEGGSTGQAGTSSAVTTTSSTGGPGDPTTSSAGTTGAEVTTTLDPDGSSEDTASTATGPMPPEPKSCALEVIDPAADPTMVIDAGDGVGQIPTIIGEVLLRNCGCHYNTNMLMPGQYIDYMSNKQPMVTWADFHIDFLGTFPMGYAEMPAYLAVEQRVVFSDPLPMPPFGCGVEGEDGYILEADVEIFADWFAAGAPDGASYP